MERSSAVLITLFLVGVVVSSGCVNRVMNLVPGGECEKIQKGLEESERVDCKCYPTDFVPDKFKNVTDIDSKCYCTCKNVEGNTSKIAIMETGEGQTIVTRLSSS